MSLQSLPDMLCCFVDFSGIHRVRGDKACLMASMPYHTDERNGFLESLILQTEQQMMPVYPLPYCQEKKTREGCGLDSGALIEFSVLMKGRG
jgi:hypothetical protein